jgi:hypothetical protein
VSILPEQYTSFTSIKKMSSAIKSAELGAPEVSNNFINKDVFDPELMMDCFETQLAVVAKLPVRAPPFIL